jgi:phosphate:Na+ symporter
MRTMSKGLSDAVGKGMRGIITKATRNRLTGIGMGSSIGFLIQSSASIVLFVGFINAGLMTLTQAIAPMLGGSAVFLPPSLSPLQWKTGYRSTRPWKSC